MAKDLLFELGFEEVPAAYMVKAINDTTGLTREKLKELRLKYDELKVYGTPRRLTIYIKGLDEKQTEAVIETRGPKKAIAYDQKGKPTKASLGFARAQGVEVDELQVKEVDGVEYIFAVKKELSRTAEDIIADGIKDIVYSIVFPKSMRWAYYHTRFARPIRWILLLFGEKVLDLQIENVKSGRFTYGHRFLSRQALEVKKAEDYFQILQDNYVLLDQDERKALIWKQVQEVARAEGGQAMENEDLLEEINYLVEYPCAFYGRFSESYLDVPPEVLTTSMIEHQRYFPLYDQAGKLMPGFIGVKNGTDYSLDIVRAGNERVLKARLEDALFFWKEDTKKPIAEMVPGLSSVLFHERLGTIMDKVNRITNLASYIGEQSHLSEPELIKRAAYLCKADLMSSMVYEFPELQGVMGRYYAILSGEDKEVSDAIFEHYLPRFASDELPVTDTGIVLSLAEKIDNLIGCFAIGIKPSGSQDPYALRRQALGIVNIVLNSELKLNLEQVLGKAYEGFKAIKPEMSLAHTVKEVIEFIFQRLRGVLIEKQISYDTVEAVFASGSVDIMDIYQRSLALQNFKNEPEFEDFMVVFNRTYNLSKKWNSTQIQSQVLADPSEVKLYNQSKLMIQQVEEALDQGQYQSAMETIARLRPDLDNFFTSVMVMVDDEVLRSARLGLLKTIADTGRQIADFSKIVF